jgi:ABC-type multidrug transport system ATPase subunit
MKNDDAVISIKNLSKRFKDIKAVDGLSFSVYRGDVFGFLGPNGAGKSTTIRMMLTLIRPSSGDIDIFGLPLKSNRLQILRKVGAIVEKPDFYKYLTAYKNIEILGRISGCDTSRTSIMKVLDIVGLSSRAHSKVKTYSHGMKQRLGIAQALLHDPELIILDEPTTGLDPQGMKEIRDLILFLSSEKHKTILLSSHLLYEIEAIANRMIIIDKGKKVIDGYVRDLINTGELEVKFETGDIQKALNVLNSSGFQDRIKSHHDNNIIMNIPRNDIARINRILVGENIPVEAIIPTRSLEQYFLNLTGGESDV